MFAPSFVRVAARRYRRHLISQYLRRTRLSIPQTAAAVALWAPPRVKTNVGDGALTAGAIAAIGTDRAIIFTRDTAKAVSEIDREVLIDRAVEVGSYKDFKASFQKLLPSFEQCSSAFLVGADGMDGKYGPDLSARRWQIAQWLQGNGIDTKVISMSWNANPHPISSEAAKRAFDAGVTVVARDTKSQQRLQDMGVDAQLAFDLSFIRTDQVTPDDSIVQWFNSGRPNIIVTVSDWVERNPSMFKLLTDSLKSLASDYQFLFVPMVDDGISVDRDSCERLADEIGGLVLPTIPNPAQLRWMAARSAFGISSRMHCCLLGFAAGMPAIGIEYQGKFEGAFGIFGLTRFVMNEANFEKNFPEALAELVKSNESLKEMILLKIPAVAKDAKSAFVLGN